MTTDRSESPDSTGTGVDRAALAARLAQTRREFHELIGSLSDDQLALPSVVSQWTVKEVLFHMSRVMEMAFAMMVRRARKNKAMPKLFNTRLAHWLNFQMARQGAGRADRQDLERRFDAALEKMSGLLDRVEDSQWTNRTAFPNGLPLTMERIFSEVVPGHFAAHAAEIRETVAKSRDEPFDGPTFQEIMASFS